MQENTTGSSPRDDKRIVCMAMIERASTPCTTNAVCYASFGVPFDAVCSRVECPQGIHCFISPCLKTTGVCTAHGAMNGGHGQWNRTTLCFLTNDTSACNIPMAEFEFGNTMCLPSAIFQQTNTCGTQCSGVILHPSDLIASMAYLFSRSIANRKRGIHACTTAGPGYTTHCYIKSTSAICGHRIYPKDTSKAFLILARGIMFFAVIFLVLLGVAFCVANGVLISFYFDLCVFDNDEQKVCYFRIVLARKTTVRLMNVPRQTVSGAIRHFKELGNDGRRPGSGRKCAVNTSRNRKAISKSESKEI
ncbi:hypothetical protein TNCV_1358181 [Trichonephila clavipes]|uniref:Uncharacterized protein n=1 Tax=Trichonephila clavipes TaxID=2585209 RepID=A0A8X6SFS3_TRICX|nr:hypothetical protein TNCV_1358181 [Trichonephila clavipes]